MFDPLLVRADFPILSVSHPSGHPLVYLDSAATSQKPQAVIDAIVEYYQTSNANIHRGIHFLGDQSTKNWHAARQTVASFFGCSEEELVLVRNTTEALNAIAISWGEQHLRAGSTILATQLEHHSNLVPWQQLCKRKGTSLELIPVLPDGTLDQSWFAHRLEDTSRPVQLLALSHVSNTLGTINPIQEMGKLAKKHGVTVVVDGAQAAPHLPIRFNSLPVDFYVVSAHKMLGPMGIGALLVKKDVLTTLEPWLFGGGMIDRVEDTTATFADDLVDRFTAGTPDVAGIVGWAAACQYLESLGMSHVAAHDEQLVMYAIEQLQHNSRVKLVGPRTHRCGSVAFVYEGVHAHDVAQILDSEGIAVRSGHHCTMPLHTHMKWGATTRISFNVYSSTQDIDRLVEALSKVDAIFT